MVVKNKKNGTNVLAYKDHGIVTRVTIGSGEQVNIPHLSDFSQIINKGDFEAGRGWFEIVASDKVVEKETNLERAKKEVIEYSEENKEKKKN
jgi:hypothetical protein